MLREVQEKQALELHLMQEEEARNAAEMCAAQVAANALMSKKARTPQARTP